MKHTAPQYSKIQRSLLLFTLIFLFSTPFSFSQRIVGYVPEYRATMNIQYAYVTHIIYAWLNADASGNLQTNTAWFTTANFNTCKANVNAVPAASRPKIIISTGGWGEPNIPTWIANATARANFITQMGNFIQTNNLDGFDLDWEFPGNATQRAQLTTFLSEMRTKLNTLQTSMCKKLELSIAVNGETTAYVDLASLTYLDFINVMAYDMAGTNHSTLAGATNALNIWNTWGAPFSKMNLGVPFYSNGGGNTYAGINSCNCATPYNTDSYNGYQYNGCPTLHAKVDMAKSKGAAGIMIWELGQDLMPTTSYSLLANCLQPYIVSTWGTPPVAANPCTLPVSITQLMAEADKNTVRVSWTTATEKDNDHFDVERSRDGKTFAVIGSRKGNGNSSNTHLYEFTDYEVSSGNYFYRLVQYDLDGTATTSGIVSVSFNKNSPFYVSPNPFAISTQLHTGSTEIGEAQLIVYDAMGTLVSDEKILFSDLQAEIGANLLPGMYVCKVYGGGEQMSFRMVKGK